MENERGFELFAISTAAVTTSTAAAAITSASAATATAAPAVATTAFARRTVFPGPSFIDGKIAAIDAGAVQCSDGGLGFLLGSHRYEGESARASGHPVEHQVDLNDRAVLGKHVLQVVLSDIVGEVSNKQFCIHLDNLEIAIPSLRPCGLPKLTDRLRCSQQT